MDITVYHNGFHGDLNETFYVGEVDEGAKKLVQTTYECLMQAIDSGKVLIDFFLIWFQKFLLQRIYLGSDVNRSPLCKIRQNKAIHIQYKYSYIHTCHYTLYIYTSHTNKIIDCKNKYLQWAAKEISHSTKPSMKNNWVYSVCQNQIYEMSLKLYNI